MWNNDRHQSISRYKIPLGGGVVGLVVLIGMGIVLIGFPFLRHFLGMAVLLGGGIALGMNWVRDWRQG